MKKLGTQEGAPLNELRTKFQEQGDAEALEARAALLDEPQNLSLGDRERLFGYLEGGGKMILAEPEALLTEALAHARPRRPEDVEVLRQHDPLREEPEAVTQKIRTMPTDPARVKRTDPGNPEKCPVWQLHQVYSDDATQGVGAEGLHHRRHRLPRVQAAGDRRDQRGAGADPRARAALSRRSDAGDATSSPTAARRRSASPTRRCATCARRWD